MMTGAVSNRNIDKFRVIIDGSASAAYNMAVDEAILIHHTRRETPPTLRFYMWQPPAVSIGYFQNINKEVDLKSCASQSTDIVRRTTGGRAVFHDKEVTYSIVINSDLLPGSVKETYRVLNMGILSGLKRLGLDAEFSAKRPNTCNHISSACFDSTSWYEITVNNKKLIGSAQTRHHNSLLQHGSILLEINVKQQLKAFNFPNGKARKIFKNIINEKATAINPELKRKDKDRVSSQDLIKALLEGFKSEFGNVFFFGRLTNKERNTANKLTEEKYSTDEWNVHRKTFF